jgi:hypothetical protein
MARCDSCDLELDDIERFCPGCGAPAPRRVVSLDTKVRDEYNRVTAGTATEFDELEYAFGGKKQRTHRVSPASVVRQPVAEPEITDELEAEPDEFEDLEEFEVSDELEAEDEDDEDFEELEVEDELESDEDEELEDLEEEFEIDDELDAEDDNEEEPEELDVDDELDTEDEYEDELESVDEEIEEAPRITPHVVRRPVAPVPVVRRPAAAEPVQRPAASVHAVAEAIAEPMDEPEERVMPYVVLPPPRVTVHVVPETFAEREAEPVVRGPSPWRAIVLTVLALAAGVAVFFAFLPDRTPSPSGPAFDATSADGLLTFHVPGTWRVESEAPGVLEVADPQSDAHVYATVMARAALPGMTLKARAAQVRQQLITELDVDDPVTSVTVKVGTRVAVRTEMTGVSVGHRVSYIQTVVKTPKNFVQVLAWAPAERYASEKDVLLRIVDSLVVAK